MVGSKNIFNLRKIKFGQVHLQVLFKKHLRSVYFIRVRLCKKTFKVRLLFKRRKYLTFRQLKKSIQKNPGYHQKYFVFYIFIKCWQLIFLIYFCSCLSFCLLGILSLCLCVFRLCVFRLFVFLSSCLSVFLSFIFLTFCLYVYLSFYFSPSWHSAFMSICLSLFLSICLSFSHSFCLSSSDILPLWLPIFLSFIILTFFLCVYLSVFLTF